jgi:hypothetical protein
MRRWLRCLSVWTRRDASALAGGRSSSAPPRGVRLAVLFTPRHLACSQ